MSQSVKELETDALKLSGKDRAELARVLLLSLGEVSDQETERLWAEEAERRYRDLKAGAVDAIASDQVFREARSRLK